MLYFTPLEQFQIISLIPMHIGHFYLSFTNSSLFMGMSTGFFLLLCSLVTKHGGTLVPTRWQSLVELMYELVVSFVNGQLGEKGKKYFPMMFTLFTFILLSNLIGLVPYGFTTTAHCAVTLGISVPVMIGVTLIGFQTHGLHFLSLLLPPGAPLALVPFLVPMELISYCFRPISLGVRVFANMMAGHMLVKILSGFGLQAFALTGMLKVTVIGPIGVVFALMFLEVGVACLQAYVFSLLTCIYLSDAINLH
jgi:ATP synthase subunit 6